MKKEFYDKYGKEFHCGDCNYLEHCIKSEEPLLNSCREEFLSCKVSDLEAKLAESEEKKESYRLQNDEHHLQLLQFYSRLGVEAFGADIHEKALETLMIMKEEIEEKNGVRRALSACNRQNDEFANMIKKLVSEKEELKQQLAEKDKEIEDLNHKLNVEQPCLLMNYQDMVEKLKARIEQANQDKISFAVEQLDKVKEYVDDLDTPCVESICNEYMCDIEDFIDQQIKQLKEMK